MRSGVNSARGVARRWLLLVVGLTFLAVLIPFLFWRAEWFGTPLSNAQIGRDLLATSDPDRMQHALSQVADRIVQGDPTVARFYPEVARLADSSVPQIRETAAWVMGQDNSAPLFHQTLLELLHDSQPLVRMNAALALVRFGDSTGHSEILQMLSGEPLLAPREGVLKRRMDVGQGVGSGSLVARIVTESAALDVRAASPGSLARWTAADGARVEAGQPIAVLAPSSKMAWEALRALYLIGTPEDLAAIGPYARGVAGMPPEVAEQARMTMQAIRERAGP